MVIFPFGFYILEGASPVYVGNNLEAQRITVAWMDANPDKVCLRSEAVGPTELATKFLGWDGSGGSAGMGQAPFLFATTCSCEGRPLMKRLYRDYEAALAGHTELIELAKSKLH
ncbi:hypothetical protein IVA98_00515 [Bradyrhizobium sp. 160]|uniref:hypothetical protein n=1 Tax=unclassified Bradyrhizobium TaxID=2631580 RepID=UPI001FF82CBD|nr:MULTISPECIES: hypothetical protein [unclassified Bradyrhizobium]MCK1546955.1 hypothetical protein [Bradyrhizobium sp. 179]MCK1621764.1 hypothetical protein [Bradyrhizobium sp. 160]